MAEKWLHKYSAARLRRHYAPTQNAPTQNESLAMQSELCELSHGGLRPLSAREATSA